MTQWQVGDIAAETNGSFLARLIQFGQMLRNDKGWPWNHILIVVDSDGNTIEAQGAGIVRGTVGNRDIVKLNVPDYVNRQAVVNTANLWLGDKYNWLGVILLGIDCLFGTRLHWRGKDRLFCSELAAICLANAGWRPSGPVSLIKPADLVDLLGTVPSNP